MKHKIMGKRRGRLFHSVVISLLTFMAAAVMMFAIPKAGAAFKFIQKGSEVPDFTLKTLDGDEVSLASMKEGKTAILLFWATWSPRSLTEMKDLEAFYQERKDEGLKIVGINVNHLTFSSEDIRAVREAIDSTGVTFPIVLDRGLEVYNSFGVVAAPSTAIIDPSGIILYEVSSYLTFTGEKIKETVDVAMGLREAPKEEVVAEEKDVYKPARKALLYYNLGRNLLKMGSKEKAIDKLATAVEADEKYTAPKILLGHLYLEESSKDEKLLAEALDLFTKSVEAEPENISALTGLGEALYRTGKYGEAQTSFQKAAGIDPTYTPAISGLASCFSEKGNHQEALGKFQEALELNPLNPDVYVRRAHSFEVQGMLKEAARDLRKAVEILLGYGVLDSEV